MEEAPKTNEQIVQECKTILEDLYERDYKDIRPEYKFLTHAMVDKKAEELRRKYSDFKEYELYHVLIGSSAVPGEGFKEFDFPGEDSVENFIHSL